MPTIESLRSKLVALFLCATLLLFCAVFALVVARDTQSSQMSTRSLLQNQLTSLAYQLQDTGTDSLAEWTDTSTLVRLRDESGVVWRNVTGRGEAADAGWRGYEEESGRLLVAPTEKVPVVFQTGVVETSSGLGRSYVGSSATVRGPDGEVLGVDMMVPLPSVVDVVSENLRLYAVIWAVVVVVLVVLSRVLVDRALRPAVESVRSQNDFIAAASHELKAPLSVIRLNLDEVGRTADVDAEARRLLAVSSSECARMGSLVDGLLSLAASDAGQWSMRNEPVPIDALLIEAYDRFEVPFGQRGQRLEVALPEGSLSQVMGDAGRLAQVVDILLDNAMAYSDRGSATILDAREGRGTVTIRVIDHGVGVPDEERTMVFQRFYRGESSRTTKSHVGLGLSIAGEIVALHGGRIGVEDSAGGGATFVVELPAMR